MKHDEVNNPKHYDLFPDQQVIDVIRLALTPEEFAGYCKGNALKYRLRAGDKGDALQCIAKANWYQKLLRTINQIKKTAATVAWPDDTRIDAIGQNGGDGEHYLYEWQDWDSGDQPVADDVLVDVMSVYGNSFFNMSATKVRWSLGYIAKWRLSEEEK